MMKTILCYNRTIINILVFAATLIFMACPLSVSASEITARDFVSLKSAVEAASEWDSIVIEDSFALPETLVINKSLTLKSAGGVALTVSGNFRHIDIISRNGGDIALEFNNVALIGRKTSPDDTTPGGGIAIIRTEGHPSTANKSNTIDTLHLVNAVIQRCHNSGLASSPYGGGIGFTWPQGQPEIDYCNLEISGDRTDISYNSANRGGGVAANHVTVNGGIIGGNTAAVWAGGIYAYGGLTMNGGVISGNKAGSYGGGSANYHGDYIINGGTISGNESGEAGGGIYTGSGLTMNGGNVEDNRTDGFAGGVCAGPAEINGGRISGNTALTNGGGIACIMELRMNSGEISGNTAGENGGGIFTYNFEGYSKDAVITGGFVGGNSAVLGGGMYAGGGASITGAVFDGNISAQDGGGLYSYGGIISITGSAINGNTAGLDGGGVWINELGNLVTDSVTFSNNKAREGYIWDVSNPSDVEQSADSITHNANILSTVYTVPFTNAYNNYDVNYASGIILGEYPNNGSGLPETKPETGNNVTGAVNYETGRIYGTPNVRTNVFDNEINLEKVTPPAVPTRKKNPAAESRPNPNTGYPDGFAFPASVLLCMGAALLTVCKRHH